MTTWWGYVERVSDGAKLKEIADKVGVTAPSVGRWKESRPDPDKAAAFARAYGRPVLEAFVAAGYLTADEAGQPPATTADVKQVSNQELIDEVTRRIERGGDDHGDNRQKMSSDAGGSTGGTDPASQPLRTEETVGYSPKIARLLREQEEEEKRRQQAEQTQH